MIVNKSAAIFRTRWPMQVLAGNLPARKIR